MNPTHFRTLSTAELFPIAYSRDLLSKQSEHFIDTVITTGQLQSGYVDMPRVIPSLPENSPPTIETNPPGKLVSTYLKNNWKPLLTVAVFTCLLVVTYYHLRQNQRKKSKN